ncbi:hypothetical protein AGMMS4952_19070 [Spirochaetia bacterium]|nr:hypothetical protein AGMMS4952_19070 [Spirochaetia bacterium]
MKRIVISVVLFSISLTIYAQNGFEVVSKEYTGNYTNHQFLSEVADVNTVRATFQQNAGRNIVIDKFFQIADDDEDAEDVRMVNWVINNELPVSPNDGDCFLVEVVRGQDNNSVDGWDVLVRYSSRNGWLYILYYFSIHSR